MPPAGEVIEVVNLRLTVTVARGGESIDSFLALPALSLRPPVPEESRPVIYERPGPARGSAHFVASLPGARL
jgi:hypothetical protein